MKSEKYLNLFFDRFSFTVSYRTVEKFIINELKRLAELTGYSIERLSIEFKECKSRNTVAYFSHQGNKPIGFCFYLDAFDGTSANKIIDTCRHEFAHYIVCMQIPDKHPLDSHGTAWKKVCKQLDAIPSAHMHCLPTRHIKSYKGVSYYD